PTIKQYDAKNFTFYIQEDFYISPYYLVDSIPYLIDISNTLVSRKPICNFIQTTAITIIVTKHKAYSH
ncbi:TPA: hypothetical protein ACQFK2_003433, partial [Proteus mirabilis]